MFAPSHSSRVALTLALTSPSSAIALTRQDCAHGAMAQRRVDANANAMRETRAKSIECATSSTSTSTSTSTTERDERDRGQGQNQTSANALGVERDGSGKNDRGAVGDDGARARLGPGSAVGELRLSARARAGEDGDECEDDVELARATALWDGVMRRKKRGGSDVVAACEDGGALEIACDGLERGIARRTPVCVWAHGMRGDLKNDDQEGLWNFWKYCAGDDGRGVGGDDASANARAAAREIAVIRYNARGYGRSSDVRRTREARWDNRGSDMIELARRVRRGDGGKVVYCGASLGAATSIWATVLAHESGVAEDVPSAIVLVTPPTFYDERESRKKKLKAKVAKGAAAENTKTPRRVFAAAREPVIPEPPCLANPNDSCAVEVLIGSAQSNLPEPERVREALRNIPCIVFAWDCGDLTHPVSSAAVIKELVPHAEINLASSHEDYDIVKHVRAQWSNAILDFLRRSVVEDDVVSTTTGNNISIDESTVDIDLNIHREGGEDMVE